jgi:hypothetical protein
VWAYNGHLGEGGTFRTLPAAEQYANTEHNPRGLFNYRFEFGSCASQNPANGIGPSLPAYDTMLREVKDDVLFAVMNGDWLYEEARDYPAENRMSDLGIPADDVPPNVGFAPTVVGRVGKLQNLHVAREESRRMASSRAVVFHLR